MAPKYYDADHLGLDGGFIFYLPCPCSCISSRLKPVLIGPWHEKFERYICPLTDRPFDPEHHHYKLRFEQKVTTWQAQGRDYPRDRLQ